MQKKPLRIVHIGPLVAPITESPPGGGEMVVLNLAAAQARRGEGVRVIACEGSRLPSPVQLITVGVNAGDLVAIDTSSTLEQNLTRVSDLASESERSVFSKVESYLSQNRVGIDVIHNHAYDCYPLFDLDHLGIPMVHSLHLPPWIPKINQRFRELDWAKSKASYVVPSQVMAEQFKRECGFSPPIIHHGVDISAIKFEPGPGENFVWAGRISREKGLHSALEMVKRKPGQKLVVMGRVYDSDYFATIAENLKDPSVIFLGHQTHENVLAEMGRAKAFLFPLESDEAFGLVVVESLAAGTPVLAYTRGAMHELIEPGVTGFLEPDFESLVKRLDEVGNLSRKACRRAAELRFSVDAMVDAFDKLYLR